MFTYSVSVVYLSLPINDIINTAASPAHFISAVFANNTLTVSYDDPSSTPTFTLTGYNANNGDDGSITATNLPSRYTIATATGNLAYTFTDPDDSATGQTNTDLADLIFTELDDDGAIITANQSSSYAVSLSLDELTSFSGQNIISSSDELLPEFNDNDNTITISAANACAAPPCADAETTALGTLTITESSSLFSIESVSGAAISLANNIATITVPDQPGATNSNVSLGSIVISNASDTAAITYDVSVNYSGTPVADIIVTILDGNDNNITNIIAASFNGFDLTPSLSGTTIALSGATNTDITNATGAIIEAAASPLPAGYSVFMATTGSPPYSSSYSFNDPDGSETDALNNHALSNLIIAEHNASDTIVNDNQTNYPVTLSLAALNSFTASHITSSSSDVTPTLNNAAIAVSVTNACAAPPCTDAETALATLTISEVADTFSIESVSTHNTISLNAAATIATITVPDQDGATSLSSDLDLGSITIKRTGDNVSQTYSISATYASTPVTDIISSILGGDNNNISNIIAASFNGFDLTPSLSGTTIALSGATNTDITDATGAIVNNTSAASRLPAGYVVTDTSGNPYSFNDPDSAQSLDRTIRL